jgi:F-type H+-transporting ATPase subunit b
MLRSAYRFHYGIRQFSSSSPSPSKMDPKDKAAKLLELIPGSSLLSKTGTLVVGTGAAAFLVSKELILFHPETLILGCFVGLTYLLYRNTSDVVANELDGYAQQLRNVLLSSRQKEQAFLEEQIQNANNAKEAPIIQKELFAMGRKIAMLQQELAAREMRHRIAHQIRHRLDHVITLEAQQRQLEQRTLLARVSDRVLTSLRDPKIQENLLQRSIAEVESVTIKK